MISCVIVFFIFPVTASAQYTKKDYFYKPQFGGWFGPVSPIGNTSDLVNSALGGGLFARINSPYQPLKFGVETAYQHFKSKGVNDLTLVPLYANALYLLPINLPVRFQIKGGLGAGYVFIKPDQFGQWDPVLHTGFEISFPAGRIVNIGLRLDYFYYYEGYVKSKQTGGHILNFGLQLYFNI